MPRDVAETLRETPISSLSLTDPLIIQTGTSISRTIQQMREGKRSCALVCKGQKVIGLFTERDILNRVSGEDVDTSGPIDGIMTKDPKTLAISEPVSTAIRMMTQAGYRHVPLVDEDGLTAGLMTAREVLTYIAEHYPAEVVNLPPNLDQTPMKVEGG